MGLNAVALEFILCLKEALFVVLMSTKNGEDLANTFIQLEVQQEKADFKVFVGSVAWLLVAVAWVLLYMGIPHRMEGLQAVLPEFRGDVHDVCIGWIKWRYCVSAVCPASPTG